MTDRLSDSLKPHWGVWWLIVPPVGDVIKAINFSWFIVSVSFAVYLLIAEYAELIKLSSNWAWTKYI